MERQQTKIILNQLVADLTQFSQQLHQVHWYMRGFEFLDLHGLMDEWREQVEEQLDEVAERLIIIGGAPLSTLEEVLATTKIAVQKGDYNKSIAQHLTTLEESYRYLATVYQTGIQVTDDEGDHVSQDVLIGQLAAVEKQLWMINAELGRAYRS